jgi:hypothetical protein
MQVKNFIRLWIMRQVGFSPGLFLKRKQKEQKESKNAKSHYLDPVASQLTALCNYEARENTKQTKVNETENT